MELKLIETTNEEDIYTEKFTTNHPKIKNVTITYIGTDKNLDNLLKSIATDYAKRNKIIV